VWQRKPHDLKLYSAVSTIGHPLQQQQPTFIFILLDCFNLNSQAPFSEEASLATLELVKFSCEIPP
jgi:hypothetical protein